VDFQDTAEDAIGLLFASQDIADADGYTLAGSLIAAAIHTAVPQIKSVSTIAGTALTLGQYPVLGTVTLTEV
jgi:hypothetical protein